MTAALVLYLLLAIVSWSVAAKNRTTSSLKAFVHIGAPKTGTKHVQSDLAALETAFRLNHFNVLDNPKYGREYESVDHPRNSHEMKSFIEMSKKHSQHVVISSEYLGASDVEGVRLLHDDLKAYETKIIFVYRNELSRLISFHNMFMRLFQNPPPLDDYLSDENRFPRCIFVSEAPCLGYFPEVFGKENIVVLDYYGMLAAGVDETSVMLCDVIGVLCTKIKEMVERDRNESNNLKNTAEDSMALQMFNQAVNYSVIYHGCTPRENFFKSFDEFGLPSFYLNQSRIAPSKPLNLAPHIATAREIDRQMRAVYSNMLYANRSATAAALNTAAYEQLDVEAVWKSSYWLRWMRDTAETLIQFDTMDNCVNSRYKRDIHGSHTSDAVM